MRINILCHKFLCLCQFNKYRSICLLKGLSQPLPFSMTSKLLIKHGETNSYCFTVNCVPEGMFNYLE